jgi:hypothetical protein
VMFAAARRLLSGAKFRESSVRKVPKCLALNPQNSAKRVEEALFQC